MRDICVDTCIQRINKERKMKPYYKELFYKEVELYLSQIICLFLAIEVVSESLSQGFQHQVQGQYRGSEPGNLGQDWVHRLTLIT